jgi:hypothetical protein
MKEEESVVSEWDQLSVENTITGLVSADKRLSGHAGSL